MNIEIQYRAEDADEGVPIAEVPFRKEAIDSVIPLIHSWGLRLVASEESIDTSLLYGQFRVLEDRVVFEVVLGS